MEIRRIDKDRVICELETQQDYEFMYEIFDEFKLLMKKWN